MNFRLFNAVLLSTLALAAEPAGRVTIDWNKTVAVSRTSISIQVCPEPPLRRGYPLHDKIWGALREMKCDYARLQPWHPYPKIGVAELNPPQNGKTSWDFSVMDPIVLDFFAAAEGRPVMLNFSTLPQWMFRTPKPVPYPKDPDEITWHYGGGNELRDPSVKEVVDYYHRLASWYMKGGFVDEYGKRHESGHHFKVAYWEVLNEIEVEHELTPRQYTAIYDAVVSDLRKLDAEMKFSGLALAQPTRYAEYVPYFLKAENHMQGIPLDMISYHFYSTPSRDESMEVQQHTIFENADRFLTAVRYIEESRKQLSPATKVYINELGSFIPDENTSNPEIPQSYWTLAASMWAYVYPQLAEQNVDVIAAAELIDYPGQYPGTTLIDWNTGKPNARYWVVKLLRDNFGPGDRLVETGGVGQTALAQAFLTGKRERKILLVNKRDRELSISVPGATGSRMEYVDQTTAYEPPASTRIQTDTVTLRPQAVAVITLSK